MKKTIVGLVMATLLIGMVSAISVDEECKANGFDFGIVKFQCGLTTYEEGSSYDNYDITVDWTNCESVTWSSFPTGIGVVSKEGTAIYKHYNSPINKTGQNDISHLTFCGEIKEIPEMTTIGAFLGLSLLGSFLIGVPSLSANPKSLIPIFMFPDCSQYSIAPAFGFGFKPFFISLEIITSLSYLSIIPPFHSFLLNFPTTHLQFL